MKLLMGSLAIVSLLISGVMFADVGGPGGVNAGPNNGRHVEHNMRERHRHHRDEKFQRQHPAGSAAVPAHMYRTR